MAACSSKDLHSSHSPLSVFVLGQVRAPSSWACTKHPRAKLVLVNRYPRNRNEHVRETIPGREKQKCFSTYCLFFNLLIFRCAFVFIVFDFSIFEFFAFSDVHVCVFFKRSVLEVETVLRFDFFDFSYFWTFQVHPRSDDISFFTFRCFTFFDSNGRCLCWNRSSLYVKQSFCKVFVPNFTGLGSSHEAVFIMIQTILNQYRVTRADSGSSVVLLWPNYPRTAKGSTRTE